MNGKLRELVGLAIDHDTPYSDTVQNKTFEILFNKINTIYDVKKAKQDLKLFCLKASNCKFGTKAGLFLDLCFNSIDKEFGQFLTELRKGFSKDEKNGEKSLAPYLTLQAEVEYMFGYKTVHDTRSIEGKRNASISKTYCSRVRTKAGVLDKMYEKGVRFFLPVHDAIIVQKEDVTKVLESLCEAAIDRGMPFSPRAKVHNFTRETERTNKSLQFKRDCLFKDYEYSGKAVLRNLRNFI